ncbi:MAG: CdaR family protein [Bacteroidia bacterium]
MPQSSDRSYRRKGAFNIKGEWKGFLFCILLASFLWLLTALNETYNSRLEVNVNYTNRPANLVYSNQLPKTLRVSVNARGWDLLGFYLRGGGGDVLLNLEEYKKLNYLATSRLKSTLQAQIADKVQIHDIYPDTISLRKERQFTKKVPIRLNMKLSFAEQYGIAGDIEFVPDSVIISGSKEVIPSINYVDTKPVYARNVQTDILTFAELKKSSTHNIAYSAERVKIAVPIDKLTERIVEVPIQIINPKFSGNVRLIPQKVTVKYQTTLTKYHQVDDNLFEIVVDGQNMDTVTQHPLHIQMLSYPKYIYNPVLEQEHVDYIITK